MIKISGKKIVNTFLSLFDLQITRRRPIRKQVPIEANDFQTKLIETCGVYSMTGPIRMWALIQSLDYIKSQNISGDIVECGVWKGGNLALMSKYRDKLELNASIYGYDTFDGMSDASDFDVDHEGNSAKLLMGSEPKDEAIKNIHAFASFSQVQNNLKRLNVTVENLVKGKVEDTLGVPKNLPKKISLLRLDTDWYESTRTELEILFPLLEKGGVLIVDDYGHFKGAQKAVDEYFAGKNIWMHYVDYTCRLMIKQ